MKRYLPLCAALLLAGCGSTTGHRAKVADQVPSITTASIGKPCSTPSGATGVNMGQTSSIVYCLTSAGIVDVAR